MHFLADINAVNGVYISPTFLLSEQLFFKGGIIELTQEQHHYHRSETFSDLVNCVLKDKVQVHLQKQTVLKQALNNVPLSHQGKK